MTANTIIDFDNHCGVLTIIVILVDSIVSIQQLLALSKVSPSRLPQ